MSIFTARLRDVSSCVSVSDRGEDRRLDEDGTMVDRYSSRLLSARTRVGSSLEVSASRA